MRRRAYPVPPVLPEPQAVAYSLADLDRRLGTIRRPEHRGGLYPIAIAAVETARAAGAEHVARMTPESAAAWTTARDAASDAYVAAWGEYADACAAATIARGLADRARTRGAA